MLKVIRFIGANLGKLDALHVKVTAAYNLWTTIYEAIKPLLPAAPAAVAEALPVAAAAPAQEHDSEGTPVELNEAS